MSSLNAPCILVTNDLDVGPVVLKKNEQLWAPGEKGGTHRPWRQFLVSKGMVGYRDTQPLKPSNPAPMSRGQYNPCATI